MKPTCAGQCCAVFSLPRDVHDRLAEGANGPVDGPFIADMIVPLTRRQARERCRRLGYAWTWFRQRTERAFYTCRHWDETTRLCTQYESRPAMCRDYPYGRACDHAQSAGCCHRGTARADS